MQSGGVWCYLGRLMRKARGDRAELIKANDLVIAEGARLHQPPDPTGLWVWYGFPRVASVHNPRPVPGQPDPQTNAEMNAMVSIRANDGLESKRINPSIFQKVIKGRPVPPSFINPSIH